MLWVGFFSILEIFLSVPFKQEAYESRYVVWTWNRKDDLSYIDSSQFKVAPLIATFILDQRGFRTELRLNSFKMTPYQSIIPVFRLEIDPRFKMSEPQIERMIKDIVSLAGAASEIQLDFDAKSSQRVFYKHFLTSLSRHKPSLSLTITALASWCAEDPWIDDLPIKYAIPMIYNLGFDKQEIYFNLKQRKKWKAQKCQNKLGLSLEDLTLLKAPLIKDNYDLFFFNPGPWSEKKIKDLKKALKE